MFLTTGCLGYTHSADPTLVNINNISTVSLSNGIYDEIYVSSATEEYDPNNKPEWGVNTKLYAHFNGNLSAGNVEYTLDTLSALRVKRRPLGSYDWITIHEITDITDVSQVNIVFYDRTCAAIDYEYALVPLINDVEGEYVIQQFKPEFVGVFIVDRSKIYSTVLSINSVGELLPQRNFASASVNPIDSKYPVVFYNGMANYESSSLTASWVLFNNETCQWEFNNNWRYRKELKDTLTNGSPKILKYEDGRAWLIAIVNNSITESADGHPDNVLTTFAWEEIGSLDSSNDLYFSGFINCNIEGS